MARSTTKATQGSAIINTLPETVKQNTKNWLVKVLKNMLARTTTKATQRRAIINTLPETVKQNTKNWSVEVLKNMLARTTTKATQGSAIINTLPETVKQITKNWLVKVLKNMLARTTTKATQRRAIIKTSPETATKISRTDQWRSWKIYWPTVLQPPTLSLSGGLSESPQKHVGQSHLLNYCQSLDSPIHCLYFQSCPVHFFCVISFVFIVAHMLFDSHQ